MVLPAAQADVSAADPERAPAVLKHRADLPPFESLLNPEGNKTQPVETYQLIVASNPNVSVLCLRQCADMALGQALLLLPGLKV